MSEFETPEEAMQQKTPLVVMGPAFPQAHNFPQFCARCTHHKVWHFRAGEGTAEVRIPCHGTNANCGCMKFCPKFEPAGEHDLYCKNCDFSVFEHRDEMRKLTWLVEHDQSARLAIMNPGDVPFKVYPEKMKLCCKWAVYRFMFEHKAPKELKPGDSIACPICHGLGRIFVIEDKSFVLGPTWKFKYKEPA